MPYDGIKDKNIVLKSIVFLLVLICFLTTPTRAYEASQVNALATTFQKELPLLTQSQKDKINHSEDLCLISANKIEKIYGIKQNLLQTIALVESGHYNTKLGRRTAWPWTVHANGKGYYFENKAKAIAAVKAMQQQGVNNIDIGCMQINLKYHGKAFQSLEEAFEPENNVAYSAKFLQKLYKQTNKDWQKTAMHYHSKNWKKGMRYKNRLEKQYSEHVDPNRTTTLF